MAIISVPVAGNNLVEGNEAFAVFLTGPSPNATIADAEGVATIVDDDSATSAIFISNASENEDGTTVAPNGSLEFTVQ